MPRTKKRDDFGIALDKFMGEHYPDHDGGAKGAGKFIYTDELRQAFLKHDRKMAGRSSKAIDKGLKDLVKNR